MRVLTGNHSFCSEGCAGADEFAVAKGDPDNEMLSDAPAVGGDFFQEATGDDEDDGNGEADESAEGNDSAEGKGVGEGSGVARVFPESDDGAGEVAVQGGGASAVKIKVAPKVTLSGCLESVNTVPSLLRTLSVSKELFRTKKEAFHQAARKTRAAKLEAGGVAAAGEGLSGAFDELEKAIAEVERVCVEGQGVIDRTLEAVDDAVSSLKPVSVYGFVRAELASVLH